MKKLLSFVLAALFLAVSTPAMAGNIQGPNFGHHYKPKFHHYKPKYHHKPKYDKPEVRIVAPVRVENLGCILPRVQNNVNCYLSNHTRFDGGTFALSDLDLTSVVNVDGLIDSKF